VECGSRRCHVRLSTPCLCRSAAYGASCHRSRSRSSCMVFLASGVSHHCFVVVARAGELFFFFSSRRRHTRLVSDWSSDVCSSDLHQKHDPRHAGLHERLPLVQAGVAWIMFLVFGVGLLALFSAKVLRNLRKEIGRASCRERGEKSVGGGCLRGKEHR